MADRPVSSAMYAGSHQYGHLYAPNSNVIQGNVYIGGLPESQSQEPGEIPRYGLCLDSAPIIDPSYFIGRAVELERMNQVLLPNKPAIEQRRLVLWGLGGIGKTQLAIAYARLYHASYTSIFWLNATTDLTLDESFRLVARRLFNVSELEKLRSEHLVLRVYQWLSDRRNTQWLLIFDNYDDPDQVNINNYLPNSAHGSAIFTTRLSELTIGQQIRVQPIDDLQESLAILQTRSQRSCIESDAGARRLAKRLAGLPLALATAGAYLRKTVFTFDQYLQAYEQHFNVNPRQPVQLQEYQDRTLYTAWNLTYSRLKTDDPLAAKTLGLLAYFDNQEIWFELLHAGRRRKSNKVLSLREKVSKWLPLRGKPQTWLPETTASRANFENVMSKLVEYCLVETHLKQGSYSMHNCVHDWTLAQLNNSVNKELYWYAVDCVLNNIYEDDWELLGELRYARLARHGLRCAHPHFQPIFAIRESSSHMYNIVWIAELLGQQVQLSGAEQMYMRALAGYEKALGPDHRSTLDTVNNLGVLYTAQGKLAEAEQMYMRALAGKEKALGPDHRSTLNTVNDLGLLYRDQGKLAEAEQMYMRALAGKEKALGPDHRSTLDTVNDLGVLYTAQGKLAEEEQMFMRALAGYEKELGQGNPRTTNTASNLSKCRHKQGKIEVEKWRAEWAYGNDN